MDYGKCYPFWESLSEKQKNEIEQSIYTEEMGKGTLVNRTEANCKGLITVLSGQLRVYIISDEGREVTLFRVDEGDICVLAASCLMDSIVFEVIIEAAKDAKIMVIPSVCFNRIMEQNKEIELYLYQTATEKFSEVMWSMQQILFQKIDQRVAGFIWDESIRQESMILSVTHDEIARNIGSAREVVTRVLKYLAQHKVIELGRGQITIIDREQLNKFL